MMQESSKCMTDSEIIARLIASLIANLYLFLYKQESSSKSRQARIDKKETGGKQETAIDEKAENTVKECTNWKDKKKDKEQEALLISEDTAFVITGENIGPKPNPAISTSAVLMSAPTSKFRGENVVFLKCKNDDLNLQKCLEKVHKLWKPYEVFIAMMCYSDAVMSRCRLELLVNYV
ncbi:hypothetical protein Tco_0331573 [Tanacetum coccineum]